MLGVDGKKSGGGGMNKEWGYSQGHLKLRLLSCCVESSPRSSNGVDFGKDGVDSQGT